MPEEIAIYKDGDEGVLLAREAVQNVGAANAARGLNAKTRRTAKEVSATGTAYV